MSDYCYSNVGPIHSSCIQSAAHHVPIAMYCALSLIAHAHALFQLPANCAPNTCQMTRRKRVRPAFEYKIRATRLPTQNQREYLSHSELTLLFRRWHFQWPKQWKIIDRL